MGGTIRLTLLVSCVLICCMQRLQCQGSPQVANILIMSEENQR